MRSDRAESNLDDEQRSNNKEVLHCGTLRRRGVQTKERIVRWNLLLVRIASLGSKVPGHCADAAQQQDKADDAPYDRTTRRRVCDKGFVGPVLRIRDVLAWTVR